jgi:tetratricopeptide (TPR) repeat protein
MKKLTGSILLCLLITASTLGQNQTPKQLHETARSFMRQGDYPNAILVLNRGLEQEPKNLDMAKDLAMSYYYQKDNTKALEIINPILDREYADDQSFQVAGLIYRQAGMAKDCERIYKKGLKKFPESGPLYNELGELQWQQQNFEAIKQWEKGIETDPSYSKNYYNASRYYYLSLDKVWSLLYGEIFINMEPMSSKAPEIKQLLVEGYKKLFSEANLEANNKDKSPFIKAFLKSMNGQSGVAMGGINTETLTMIRARFILDWFSEGNPKFKYRLFAYQQQLLKEGLFDAYNQWLFGSVQNLSAYQNWVNTNNNVYTEFQNFQKGRIFKVQGGEYYK